VTTTSIDAASSNISASDVRAADASSADAQTPLRFVTAASLFDGHDAAINIMRRVLLSQGAEVIHLGHDRGAAEVVQTALEEDADAIAISSYQGGHIEYFQWMVDLLREAGRPDILVFGGGGGTITDKEIAQLHAYGVEQIYSVEAGRRLGLVGMIDDMMERCRTKSKGAYTPAWNDLSPTNKNAIAQTLTYVEKLGAQAAVDADAAATLEQLRQNELRQDTDNATPILGITGTGGAGKSSLTDELVRRFGRHYPDRHIAVLSVDPSRRRTGGALLGDRIRMNSVGTEHTFMRSMATRQANLALASGMNDALGVLRKANFDLIILETAGIGQSSTEVIECSDLSLYVMTPEFGAPTQLEKIDMLDYADIVAINKADKYGADDALRHVRKQMQRNRGDFDKPMDQQPAFLCKASRFGDEGVNALFDAIVAHLGQVSTRQDWDPQEVRLPSADVQIGLPDHRARHLAEVAEHVRAYKRRTQQESEDVWKLDGLARTLESFKLPPPRNFSAFEEEALRACTDPIAKELAVRYNQCLRELSPDAVELLRTTPALLESYRTDTNTYQVRGRDIHVENYRTTLAGLRVPRVAVPNNQDLAAQLRWRRLENVPGEFPFTAGVFPYKRDGEDPTRMFAGEGTPERTNRRFHLVAQAQPAARLSTAFDSVTLYGRDPQRRPDVFGKIGNSGVNVATLDDAKRLYSGFDLCAPTTSVSMTINGPAPVVLAFFLNTAIDQAAEAWLKEQGQWEAAQEKIQKLRGDYQPTYRADELPPSHDGSGLGLLGVHAQDILEPEDYERIRARVLSSVRGTVQADILKEDQAQNTCIFSTDFALKMMGDIQEFFVENDVKNFYSVAISGYHIAEAGANPITQLAFTLANGFTIVEYYRARGMNIDKFARNLSFFFSNGIDAEYSVIGRVARRIWAIAMKEIYGANERSQKLKYHIQTSGRSLHAQEIAFNDIRTTLQAFYAIADNCNSLHTNAYDEAITTPTEESVRRALAIQLIINRELGLMMNENPMQGSHITDYLTDLVEEAVLEEFIRLSQRGGVLGAMELMYQRTKIQDESLEYESKKHSGEIPIIGVNTFLSDEDVAGVVEVDMARSTDEEKELQIQGVEDFRRAHEQSAKEALENLKRTALNGGNIFEELMTTVRYASAGQITDALFDVGGQYRRNM